jgi:CopG family nickel-responsive transcriptional regulator
VKEPLIRFGVAFEGSLLRALDLMARTRGCTRSELLRDLSRAEVGRAKVPSGVDAVGTLTLVYEHHVRGLSEKLTELQHELGEAVRATLHVHLSHDLCLEVIVIRGRSDHLVATADRILAIRGVKHGGMEIVPSDEAGGSREAQDRPAVRTVARDSAHAHAHPHPHLHAKPRARRQ